jgi:hypothetical protein
LTENLAGTPQGSFIWPHYRFFEVPFVARVMGGSVVIKEVKDEIKIAP